MSNTNNQSKRYKIKYVYGEYKDYDGSYYSTITGYECPICKERFDYPSNEKIHNFCPNCGVGLTKFGRDRK